MYAEKRAKAPDDRICDYYAEMPWCFIFQSQCRDALSNHRLHFEYPQWGLFHWWVQNARLVCQIGPQALHIYAGGVGMKMNFKRLEEFIARSATCLKQEELIEKQ